MDHASTINYPGAFERAKPAGFDGEFDWSWTQGCFGETKITPMDLDGVIERRGNFLVFETKDNGVEIPKGQLITLESLHKIGCFTIMIIYGKLEVETFVVWWPVCFKKERYEGVGVEKAKEIVSRWFEWACKNQFKKR